MMHGGNLKLILYLFTVIYCVSCSGSKQFHICCVNSSFTRCTYNSRNIRILVQGCTSPKRQVAVATKFCVVEPNICGCSVRNLLRATPLVPRNLRWLLGFGENL